MRPADIWSEETRFIEFGVQNAALAAFLVAQGFARYLGVFASKANLATVRSTHAGLASKLTYSAEPRLIERNNADVILLSGSHVAYLKKYRALRHARFVAWCPALRISTVVASVVLLVNLLLRRFTWKGIIRYSSRAGTRWLVVVGIRRRKRPNSARHYIPHELGMAGFLARLSAGGVQHVVLRWFDTLPHLPAGEDLDLLVADDHFARVRAILEEGPGTVPCDLYTVTGLPGSDYRRMPYYPPYLAESMLAEATSHAAGCRVPSPRHHFLSLAYHALYHKGKRSGLPTCQGAPRSVDAPEHDYQTILGALAARLGVDCPMTLEDLDAHLESAGWRPPRDMLTRLAAGNAWVAQQVRQWKTAPDDAGLAVFVVRAEGLRRRRLGEILARIEHGGFGIVRTKVLTPEESTFAARRIRGGNWGRGPWRMSGGPPAAAIVAYDVEPVAPTARQRKRFPHLSNARLGIKEKIRDAFNQGLPPARRCNILHSSDNGHEALDYIRILMPKAAAEIGMRIVEMRRRYRTEQPVLKTLTRNGRRAKVELVIWNGQLAVKKTFKEHGDRFRRREVEAFERLGRSVPEVPPLLHADGNSVICPYYENVLPCRWSPGRLLPLGIAKQVIAALRKVYDAGFALIDAHVTNVIVDRTRGLKLIDFEFLYRYVDKPSSFTQSYDIAGCPPDFEADLPEEGAESYATSWQPIIGLSLHSLLHDPTWLQHAKRFAYVIAHQPHLMRQRMRGRRQAIKAAWRRLTGPVRHGSIPNLDEANAVLVKELLGRTASADSPAHGASPISGDMAGVVAVARHPSTTRNQGRAA